MGKKSGAIVAHQLLNHPLPLSVKPSSSPRERSKHRNRLCSLSLSLSTLRFQNRKGLIQNWEFGFLSVLPEQETHNCVMSTRVTRGAPLRGYASNSRRRKTVQEVDLNVPPSENRDQEGTSADATFLIVEPSAPIDVEAFDDDVVISSPRAFAQAKYNSRRRRGRSVVVDVDSEERTSRVAPIGPSKRRRISTNPTVVNSDPYIHLDVFGSSMRENVQSVIPPPPPPPPKETIFKCPVCIGPFVEETSTKCGHIFCKACIKRAIGAQGKCPTCRRKVNIKDTIRIYLPASD